MLPEASVVTRPGNEFHTGAHLIQRHVVEQQNVDAQRDDIRDLLQAVDFHLQHDIRIERTRPLDASARRLPVPISARWLSLIKNRS